MSENIKQLADIISDYRKNEVPVKIDERHVERWIRQFDEDDREIVLSETTHILSRWYFNDEKINAFINDVHKIVKDKYEADSICYLNCQGEGNSQQILINKLNKRDIISNTDYPRHLIYVDDGLYSGRHIIKDISEILSSIGIKSVSSIDIFVLIGYTDGIKYVKKIIEPLCVDKDIQFRINVLNVLQNDKTIIWHSNGYEYKEYQDVIWPLKPKYQHEDDIGNRINTQMGGSMYYYYREYARHYKSNIFSCDNNRELIENVFLEIGARILPESSFSKGLYPLGFSAFPSLGFGSFCATSMNISNTCPVVLWWGNIQKKGDVLDIWYPLFPRRINGSIVCP